jgi:hypothetical protein
MNSAQRDERRNRLAARSRQLLVTEIQGLESLFSSTPKSRARSAEADAAPGGGLRRARVRGLPRQDRERDQGGRGQEERTLVKRPGSVARPPRPARSSSPLARRRSSTTRKLKKEYPKWCQATNARILRRARAARTRCSTTSPTSTSRRRSSMTRARSTSSSSNWPKSKYIPNAYLAFGELFFNEAQGDPSKWALAEQSYSEVVKYPPPDNKVFGYAHYKLGYVHWNKGDYARALSEFKKTIDYGVQYSQLPNALSSRSLRGATSSRSTRSWGDPKKALRLLQAPFRRHRVRQRQDLQDDGRPRPGTTSTPVTTTRASRSTRT